MEAAVVVEVEEETAVARGATEKGAATGAAVMESVEGMVVEGMRSEVQKVR